MSKQVTLQDLNLALKPILDAIADLQKEQVRGNTQLTDLYSITTNLSTKFDLLAQGGAVEVTEEAKKPVRKPVKKGAKKVTKVDEPTTETTAEEPTADEPATEEPTAEPEEPEQEAKQESKPKKPAKKKVVVKKTRPPNKIEFFNKMFDSDPDYFSTYLTPAVIKKLAGEHPEWNGMSESDKLKARKSTYYHYMKDNHESVLQSMKDAHISDSNRTNVVLAEKE